MIITPRPDPDYLPRDVVTTRPRTCEYCGKNLNRHRGFFDLIRQPGDEIRGFCSVECLHWQLHEDEKL